MTSLDALSRGFRKRYLRYDALTAQLQDWAQAYPDLARLQSLGQTPEGRELWLLTIGKEPDRIRPAAWVDGNMHAGELCGSSAALAIAEDMLRLHLEPQDNALHRALEDVLIYVVPRVSPDGAEAVLRDGRFVRSVPRPPQSMSPRWLGRDMDGDGLALSMRKEDPSGDYVEAPDAPGLMLPRELEDPGPFYKLWPEGLIERFDGLNIPSPDWLSDNSPDLNRNFPWLWMPEPEQAGAGPFPLSEPESAAVARFVCDHPNIFVWLNLHTFGGVGIRPLGDKPDSELDPMDLAYFNQVGAWLKEHLGYPMVSGFHEFTYDPKVPIYGDLTEFAYQQRGCIAFVCELWDIFEQLQLPEQERFVDRYRRWDREDLIKLYEWDQASNAGRIFKPFSRFAHPQLGEVEIGGPDDRVGFRNPPYEKLDEVCRGMSAVFLRMAAMQPKLVLEGPRVTEVGEGRRRIDLTVRNIGYLPTYITEISRERPYNTPLFAELKLGSGLFSPDPLRVELGHLDGWGHGRHQRFVHMHKSAGSTSVAHASWLVEGPGTLTLRVGGGRVGTRVCTIDA